MRLSLIVALAPCVVATTPVAGQGAAPGVAVPAAAVASAKRLEARRVRPGALQLDGRLDDVAWQTAVPISDFVQKQPVEGAPPLERTEVRVLYDDDALWVGARMYGDPRKLQAPVSRRDNIGQAEHLLISLDTYLDRRTAYTFGVTASGVRGDWYHPSDDEYHTDASFDPVWEARAVVDSLGWTAEMRIPFSQLRFTAQQVQRWGVNFDRWIPARNEDDFWIPVPRNVRGWASHFGTLDGIEGIRPSRRVELLPYVATNTTLRGTVDRDDPFDARRESNVRVGGDLRLGLGPSLTLEATVNPDFGQVEADPAEVNLSAFETFFTEKRPFFTEANRVLASGSYFYSRRIGARPRGEVGSDYFEQVDNTTILGAAKLTGRLRPGLSIGALAAVTDRERARGFDVPIYDTVSTAPLVIDTTPGAFRSAIVEPRSGYGVLRLRQEFGANASTVGVIATGIQRDLSRGDSLWRFLNRRAFTGGADWNLRFARGTYELAGNVGVSHIEGDSSAILLQQRSSRRYFQRPDADYVDVDPGRTTMTGTTGSLSLAKNSGRHWLWELYGGWESPGLELNDAGRISTSDGKIGVARLTWRETRPASLYRDYEASLSSENEWDFGGERNFGALRGDAAMTFRNFWRLTGTSWIDFRSLDPRLTRGGPYAQLPQSVVGIVQLSNSFAATTRWNGRVYYGQNEDGGVTYRLSGGLSFRPGPRWQLSVDPNYLRFRDPWQYVATRAGNATQHAATYGARYIFGRIDQAQFRLPIRLNFAIRPDLTFELWAEPFAASGTLSRFGELREARGRELRRYGEDGTTIDDPGPGGVVTVAEGADTVRFRRFDFNDRSLRSNMVMRWEWRPGSTLYVVWQHDTQRAMEIGPLVRATDIRDAFAAGGDNFLAVKMDFWIPVTRWR